jgi:hypothetical protein
MKSFSRALIAIFGLVVVVSVVSLVPQKNAVAQNQNTQPVKVVNTPLPVTGNITGTISGTVAAQQSGAWNVGINGTPSVTVSNFPSTQPVSISNTSTTPLYVDIAESNPYQSTCQEVLTDTASPTCNLSAVPTGDRLIIESASFLAATTNSSINLQVAGIVGAGGDVVDVPMVQSPSTALGHTYSNTVRVVFFVPAGTTPKCVASFDANDPTNQVRCTVTGHLVAAP